MRDIGVGLVSVGWMGRLHTGSYSRLPAVYPELGLRPRLGHAADTSAERREYARSTLGYQRTSADYADIIADPDVEVVSICAPNFLHAEIGRAAAEAGKPFWIEKPAGRDAVETESIARAAAAAGVESTVGFNYRHAPAVEHARELVASGVLGRITNVRGTMFADYSAEPDGALSWRFVRALAGSGVLGDLMGHLVDLVHYVVGPIEAVSSITRTVHAERPVLPLGSATHFAVIEGGERKPVENEDYAAMLVRLAGGAAGALEASRVTVGRRAHYGLEVYGTEGSLAWDFERMNELQLATRSSGAHVGFTRIMAGPGFGDFGRFQPGAGTPMGYDDLKVVEAAKFLAAVIGESHRNSTIEDALAAARVISAAEESARSDAWVGVVPTAVGVRAKEGSIRG